MVARLRALSAARLAVTVFVSGCGGQAATLDLWPSSRIADERGAETGEPWGEARAGEP